MLDEVLGWFSGDHRGRFQVGAQLPLDELLSVGKGQFCELGCPKWYHYGDIVFCHSLYPNCGVGDGSSYDGMASWMW